MLYCSKSFTVDQSSEWCYIAQWVLQWTNLLNGATLHKEFYSVPIFWMVPHCTKSFTVDQSSEWCHNVQRVLQCIDLLNGVTIIAQIAYTNIYAKHIALNVLQWVFWSSKLCPIIAQCVLQCTDLQSNATLLKVFSKFYSVLLFWIMPHYLDCVRVYCSSR